MFYTELAIFGVPCEVPDPESLFHAPALARSRNTNFWILPVEVLGKGPKITWRGALKCAICPRQKAMISAGSAWAPAFKVTKAQGVSPQFASGFASRLDYCSK